MKEYNGIINITEPENDYCVYKMYSVNEEDKSIYIGVSQNYKQRAYKHSSCRKSKENAEKPLYIWINDIIDNKGEKVIFEVIDKELSEKQAFDIEIEYIKQYKDLGYIVLNLSEGGKGNKGNTPWNKNKTYSKEHVIKLSEAHKGKTSGMKDKKHSDETKVLLSLKNKGLVSKKRKKVYKYDGDTLLLAEYSSLKEAAKQENVSPSSVGEWCRKEKQPRNGFVYSYSELN
jgi:predicted GIY-YIG superfamily endonuclease